MISVYELFQHPPPLPLYICAEEFLQKIILVCVVNMVTLRTGYCSSNDRNWYWEGTRFDSQSGHQVHSQVFRAFPQSLQADARMPEVPQLCHNRFFSNPFQFIIHVSF
jgi:hypothetical protein